MSLGNCLFGAVKLTKNADPDKCGYSVYDCMLLSCYLCVSE